MFDTSSPFGAFGPKLAYAIFSPFPWQGGSVALQFAKLEVFGWYYLFYKACRTAPHLWRERRSVFLMFLTFIGPIGLMYTMGFSNVGLALRQRMPFVIVVSLLAAVGWQARPTAKRNFDQTDAGNAD